MRVSIMVMPIGFKIRKKADVEVFIQKCMQNNSDYNIITDENSKEQFIFRKDKNGNVSVAYRNGNLNDIFNPMIEVARTNDNCYKATVQDYIWKNRKYINAKWFNDNY